MTILDPDLWAETLHRTLQEYVVAGMQPAGVYDVVMEFPAANVIAEAMPLAKTIVHFDIDDAGGDLLGVGDSAVMDGTEDNVAGTVALMEAEEQMVSFDVGIWTSDFAGGVTARLRAYRRLKDLFMGARTRRELQENKGLEIINFRGGVFSVETINDIRVYRIMGIDLDIRVFSRKIYAPIPYVGSFVQTQELSDQDGTDITG